uniref:Uncharacterized protein n=1 Tax=Vombatus ursinus TaxID=29139 RepID=A0A4X2JXW1_VOMUR
MPVKIFESCLRHRARNGRSLCSMKKKGRGSSIILKIPPKAKRTQILQKPNYSLNLWTVIKNHIGEQLSRIPLLVNFSEPLSMLQRLTEDLECHGLLDQAVQCENSLELLRYMAAFVVSSSTSAAFHTNKSFKPLLGETFELDQMEENGLHSLHEQVSHPPPAVAHHANSRNGWTLYQEIKITHKFHGKCLNITPSGSVHWIFHASGHHYTWKKTITTVNDIIVGKLWLDQSSEIEIANHETGDKCILRFVPYNFFSLDVPRKVTGQVTDFKKSTLWGSGAKMAEGKHQERNQKTEHGVILWKRNPLPENAENMYYFSEFALTLNAWEDGIAPTDSQLRPDQRVMENGHGDEANTEKWHLEEKRHLSIKKKEAKALRVTGSGTYNPYKALWFEQKEDPITKELIHMYRGEYWECKDKQDWPSCPDIFSKGGNRSKGRSKGKRRKVQRT